MRQGKWWAVKKQCKEESESIGCRCLATWKSARFPIFTGKKSTWSLAGKWVPRTWQCFDNPDPGVQVVQAPKS
jgi:hypothetical protein